MALGAQARGERGDHAPAVVDHDDGAGRGEAGGSAGRGRDGPQHEPADAVIDRRFNEREAFHLLPAAGRQQGSSTSMTSRSVRLAVICSGSSAAASTPGSDSISVPAISTRLIESMLRSASRSASRSSMSVG